MTYGTLIEAYNEEGILNKVVSMIPGTRIVFGWKDNNNVYIKLPHINTTIDKILNIFTYKILFDDFTWIRGETVLDTNVGQLLERKSYYRNEIAWVEEDYFHGREDYNLEINKKGLFKSSNGILSLKSDVKGAKIPCIKVKPKDIKKNRGITLEKVVIDPKLILPVRHEMYEEDELVVLFILEDLKIDEAADVSDNYWLEFYK